MTALYIGGNTDQLNTDIYKNFVEGEVVDIVLKGVIYVPNRIIGAFAFTDYEVQNEFPHMTLMMA